MSKLLLQGLVVAVVAVYVMPNISESSGLAPKDALIFGALCVVGFIILDALLPYVAIEGGMFKHFIKKGGLYTAGVLAALIQTNPMLSMSIEEKIKEENKKYKQEKEQKAAAKKAAAAEAAKSKLIADATRAAIASTVSSGNRINCTSAVAHAPPMSQATCSDLTEWNKTAQLVELLIRDKNTYISTIRQHAFNILKQPALDRFDRVICNQVLQTPIKNAGDVANEVIANYMLECSKYNKSFLPLSSNPILSRYSYYPAIEATVSARLIELGLK